MFSHWLGPCLILRKKSSHSYVIDVDGVHRTVHVNHLRKFHPSISEVNVNNCAMIFDSDEILVVFFLSILILAIPKSIMSMTFRYCRTKINVGQNVGLKTNLYPITLHLIN